MLAWPPKLRSEVRWFHCMRRTVVFIDYGPFVARTGQTDVIFAVRALDSNAHPGQNGGEMVNVHNCKSFAAPNG
jgi:hypothetical protein